MSRRSRRFPVLLAFLALPFVLPLACGDSPTGGDEPDPPRLPAVLAKVSGDAQPGVVGTALEEPLVVEVTDATGAPVAGVTVSWEVTAGTGTLSSASTASASDGRASVTWTLCTTAGQNGARATVTGLTPVAFTATGAADGPAVVDVSPAEATLPSAGDTLRLAASVADRHGNAIEEPELTWSTSDSAVAVVDAAGLVTARGAGETTITAVADTARGTATVTVAAAQPARIVISPSADTINALQFATTLTAEVTDAAGAPMPGAQVSWTSLDEAVAIVHPDSGIVIARSPGLASVVGAAGAVADTAEVLVRQIPATLHVHPEVDTIPLDHRAARHLTAYDSAGIPVYELSATWSSADPAVAEVDPDGIVHALAVGTATIIADAGSAADSATILVVDNTFIAGDTVSGVIATRGERGVFRFAAEAGQEAVVFFRSSPGNRTLELRLLAGYGTAEERLLSRIWSETGGTETWTSRIELPDDDVYAIAVESLDPLMEPEAYTFHVYPVDPTPESIPAEFAVGDTVAGESLDHVGDLDTFIFQADAGTELTAFFQPLPGAGELALWVYEGLENLGDSGWRAGLFTPPVADLDAVGFTFRLETGGSHIVVIDGRGEDDAGPYRFELYPIDRAPESVPDTIVVGDTISGEAIDRQGDIDTFFVDPEGRATEILFQPMGDAPGSTRLEVYRDDGGLPTREATLRAGIAATLDEHTTGPLPPIPLKITIGEFESWTGPYRMLVRLID